MTDIFISIIKNIDYTIPILCIKAMAFIIGFFLVSIILANFYVALYHFLFNTKYGYRTKFISIFGLVFTKKDNKWIKIFYQPSPLCASFPTIDSNNIQEDYLKKEKELTYSERYTKLFLSIIILILTLKPIIAFFKGEALSLIELFFIGFSTGMVFHSISHIGISNYVYGKLYKGLLGYIHDKSEILRKDNSFENLELKPIEELPYKFPSEMEKIFYYLFYCTYLLSLNKREEMRKVSNDMSDILFNKNMNLAYYLAYYWLVFYYSEIKTNKEKADCFFKKIEPIINNDEDSNAKRVLAYYHYRINKDSEKAKKLIEEGLSRIDQYAFGADRTLEKDLMIKLKKEI